MILHPRRVSQDTRDLVLALVEPLHTAAVGAEPPKLLLHVAGKAAAAVVALDFGEVYAVRQQPPCGFRLGHFHRILCVVDVEHIRLVRVLAVNDAAKIVRAGVRRVGVAADMRKQRIAVLVPRNVRIGLEAAVQTAFQVDRLLLVVR